MAKIHTHTTREFGNLALPTIPRDFAMGRVVDGDPEIGVIHWIKNYHYTPGLTDEAVLAVGRYQEAVLRFFEQANPSVVIRENLGRELSSESAKQSHYRAYLRMVQKHHSEFPVTENVDEYHDTEGVKETLSITNIRTLGLVGASLVYGVAHSGVVLLGTNSHEQSDECDRLDRLGPFDDVKVLHDRFFGINMNALLDQNPGLHVTTTLGAGHNLGDINFIEQFEGNPPLVLSYECTELRDAIKATRLTG